MKNLNEAAQAAINDMMRDMRSLDEGEFARTGLNAVADLKAHPEREAKANLLNAAASLVWVLVVLVAACVAPVVIWAWQR